MVLGCATAIGAAERKRTRWKGLHIELRSKSTSHHLISKDGVLLEAIRVAVELSSILSPVPSVAFEAVNFVPRTSNCASLACTELSN